MCWPTCKSGAYLGVSVFIYRAVLVAISMISSSITRLKTTYLPLTVMEELLLQLIYFISIFTSSSFVFIGLESDSFTFVLYATLVLGTTLFSRYVGELTYIYLVNWGSLRQKLPSLILNMTFDLILLLVILLYAKTRLRNKKKVTDPWTTSKDIYEQEVFISQQPKSNYSNISNLDSNSNLPKRLKETNILNDLAAQEEQLKNRKYHNSLNPTDPSDPGMKKPGGVGQGLGAGVHLHHPSTLTFDPERQGRALPPLPPDDELDDISLPPPVPLASYDYDDFEFPSDRFQTVQI